MRRSRNQNEGNERQTISANIRPIRQQRGYSQRLLADLSGVSESSVYFWEQGRHRPHKSSLVLVAEALQVSVEQITGE